MSPMSEVLFSEPVLSQVQRLLSRVASFTLRRHWTEQRLAACVRVTIPGDRQAVRVTGGDGPEVSIWLEVQNLSPFSITVDRLFGDIFCGPKIASFVHVDPKTIEPLHSDTVYLSIDMTDAKARQLAVCHEKRVRISLQGFARCRVRDFKLIRDFETTHVELTNIRPALQRVGT
jgi:hypothetical protein